MSKKEVCLTIAGSDSGGGAGIQADLKTFEAYKCFGLSAITALTAQNTLGVQAIHSPPSEFLNKQLTCLGEDFPIDAFKTGMLASIPIIETIADFIQLVGLQNYVLDPVMVAKGGHRLLDQNAEKAIVKYLFPLATLITPNLEEAEVLLGSSIRSLVEMKESALELAKSSRNVLLKGGHLEGDQIFDILIYEGKTEVFEGKRIHTGNTHGTGCTLSAAITAGLARGQSLYDSVKTARKYVFQAIESAPKIGSGQGPLNHGVGLKSRWI